MYVNGVRRAATSPRGSRAAAYGLKSTVARACGPYAAAMAAAVADGRAVGAEPGSGAVGAGAAPGLAGH